VGLTHTNDVDLVLLDEEPPLLAYEVITTGRLLLGDRKEQVRFEIEAIRHLIDTIPIRRTVEEAILRRIGERAKGLKGGAGRW